MATSENICARPSLLTPTHQGNQESFALARTYITNQPGSFALCVRTDDYRRDDRSLLDIHAGDALIFMAASLDEQEPSGLGIRLRIGKCVLARRKDSSGWLVLLEVTGNDGTELRDLASGEAAERDCFTLLGVLNEKRRSYCDVSFEAGFDDMRDNSSFDVAALARMTVEETLADGDAVVTAMRLVTDNSLFADLRAEFVAEYACEAGDQQNFDSSDERKDHALRLLCGQMFRAGELSRNNVAAGQCRAIPLVLSSMDLSRDS